jgi:CTD kinase subunit gamma
LGLSQDSTAKMMVDPFEVRMRFTTQLQHLSASVTSSQKAAHYALKYRDLDEDLHSCILEQIERVRTPSAFHCTCYGINDSRHRTI